MLLRLILVSCHSFVGSPKQERIDRLTLLISMGFDYGFFTHGDTKFNIFNFLFVPFSGCSFLCIGWRHVKSPPIK